MGRLLTRGTLPAALSCRDGPSMGSVVACKRLHAFCGSAATPASAATSLMQMVQTLVLTWGLANVAFMLLIPRVRRMVFATLESLLTIVLLLILIVLVLAMPIG